MRDDRAMKETEPPTNSAGDSQKAGEDREPVENRTRAVAGLVIAVVLLALGWWLVRELTAASKMQDCLMSGRTNCNVIQSQ